MAQQSAKEASSAERRKIVEFLRVMAEKPWRSNNERNILWSIASRVEAGEHHDKPAKRVEIPPTPPESEPG